MSTKSVTVTGDIVSLSELYDIADKKRVNRFLSVNPILINELSEVYHPILSVFPTNTMLNLALSTDYESGTDTLFIEVDNGLTFAENLDIIRDIEMDWWGDLDISFRRLVSLDAK